MEILKFHLQCANCRHSNLLIFLGMELRFSRDGVHFCLHQNCRAKYLSLLEGYLGVNCLEAEELVGRLSWSCTALFDRCGRAYLSPVFSRASNNSLSVGSMGR